MVPRLIGISEGERDRVCESISLGDAGVTCAGEIAFESCEYALCICESPVGEWLCSGMLGSGSSLPLEGSIVSSVTGVTLGGSACWPRRLGACRLRVFFLTPAGALRPAEGVEMPPRVAALLGAIVSAFGIGDFLKYA